MKPFKLAMISASLIVLTAPAIAGAVAPDDVVFNDGMVAVSLTGAPGDPVKGRAVFANRKQGNCLACHTNSEMSDQSFHGEVGPTLDGVGDRYEEAQLRGILVNSKNTFEGSIMPSFYRLVNGVRTMEKFEGKTILTAEQVEDVLAYISTLKE